MTQTTHSNNDASSPYCLPDEITPEQFLAEYWQKKPLLIKQGLPQLANWFEPEDILGLSLDEAASARLITQQHSHSVINGTNDENATNNTNWQVKKAPLNESDFDDLPPQWTVLIQNLEQWSPELGQLWEAFVFIPRWQRDDIMVSYAPAGGSVGKHYDDYDVFLAQGYGHRRWQLGKYCDETTEFIPEQPIRIFDDMGEIIFNEILEPGDVLYVPPKLSHYGLAEDDCLTFSFGFRRPNLIQILDSLVDTATTREELFTPMLLQQGTQPSGKLTDASIDQIKGKLLTWLQSDTADKLIAQAIAETVSKREYDQLLADERVNIDTLQQALQDGALIKADYSSQLVYIENENGLFIYANGQLLEDLECAETDNNELTETLLKRLADGEALTIDDLEQVDSKTILTWLENGWVWLDIVE